VVAILKTFFHERISTNVVLWFAGWLQSIGYEEEARLILTGLGSFLQKRIRSLKTSRFSPR